MHRAGAGQPPTLRDPPPSKKKKSRSGKCAPVTDHETDSLLPPQTTTKRPGEGLEGLYEEMVKSAPAHFAVHRAYALKLRATACRPEKSCIVLPSALPSLFMDLSLLGG